MRAILIIMSFFLLQGQSGPKKYVNKEYGFSILLPTIGDSQKQKIDVGFANISRIRIVADTQLVHGLVKYNVTYRVIAENFTPIGKVENAAFYKNIKDGIIAMQDKSFVSNNVKVLSKKIETKSTSTVIIYNLEYIDFPLLETRKLIIKENKSFCISYLTRPEYFDEKQKDAFINSLNIE
jgi:hypothetical protein